MDIGTRIDEILCKADITPYSAAKVLQTHRTTIANYISSKTFPDSEFILLFCNTFNVNPLWLLTGKGERDYLLFESKASVSSVVTDNSESYTTKSEEMNHFIETIKNLNELISGQREKIKQLEAQVEELKSVKKTAV